MRAAQSVSGYEELARYQLLVDSITDYAIFMLDAEDVAFDGRRYLGIQHVKMA